MNNVQLKTQSFSNKIKSKLKYEFNFISKNKTTKT